MSMGLQIFFGQFTIEIFGTYDGDLVLDELPGGDEEAALVLAQCGDLHGVEQQLQILLLHSSCSHQQPQYQATNSPPQRTHQVGRKRRGSTY